MLRYAVVDLDHTLISSGTVEGAWVFACEAGGVDARTARIKLWEAAGTPIHRLFESLGFSEQMADRLTDIMWTAYRIDPHPLKGAERLLETLRAAGLRVYLSTGSHPDVLEEVLQRLQWHDRFDLALGTDRACEKGAAHYARFHVDAGVDAERFGAEAVSIGDGAGDMAFARAAGVAVRCGIGELPEYRRRLLDAGATHLVTSTAEAVPLLETLLAAND